MVDPVEKIPYSLKGILAGVAKTVADYVGDQLSQTGSGANALPSVFVENSLPPKPATPYSCVIHKDTENYGLNYRDRVFDEVAEEETFYFHKIVDIRIQVHGSVSDDVQSIAENLKDLLCIPAGDNLYQNSKTKILSALDVGTTSMPKNSDFEEVAVLSIRVLAERSVTVPTGVIETIQDAESMINLIK